MPTCPAGHASTAADYCDDCGLAIVPSGTVPPAQAQESPAPSASAGPAQPCPDCGAPKSGRFCENCGYDFVTGAVEAKAELVASTPVAHSAGEVAEPALGPAWSAVAAADRAYFDSMVARGGPDAGLVSFPPYCPDRHYVLVGQQVRIGRRSRARGVVPEIDLSGPPEDPGVSHVHAVLLAQPDGTWVIVDPGSTNGTTVNDDQQQIRTNIPVPLRHGDRIHVGAWTTITLHAPAH